MTELNLKETMMKVLETGKWGTVGPKFTEASKAFAEYTDARHGLLCGTFDGAYEAVLRQCASLLDEDTVGDIVITGEIGTPSNSLVALCTGADVRFAAVCEKCGMISPDALSELLDTVDVRVRAVTLDYLAENKDAELYPLEKVRDICKAHTVPLIINAGGCIGARHNGRPLTELADAVVYSLESGSAVDIGKGGLVTTNDAEVFDGAYAYHNCGRSPGVGSTLDMDTIIGGDLRISEWNAAIAAYILSTDSLTSPRPRELVMMKGQPVFDK